MTGISYMVILTVYNLLKNSVKSWVLQHLWKCYPHQYPETESNTRISFRFRVLMWTTAIYK